MKAWLVLLAALSGCTLIDQRTFDPHAGEKPVVASAAASPPGVAPELGREALLRIPLPAPADARDMVARAVKAAQARKPDVVFEVVEIAPDAAAQGAAAAAAVGRWIVADGVAAARVHLAARPEANVRREVRVYVR